MRNIGVDLHTTQITVCYLKRDGTQQEKSYRLEELSGFVRGLKKTDAVAVEATGNSRWFVNQVKERVGKIVIVNPQAFEVVKKSVNKTDRNDARNLAKFLAAGLLPEVRGKSEEAERVGSLNETRLLRCQREES